MHHNDWHHHSTTAVAPPPHFHHHGYSPHSTTTNMRKNFSIGIPRRLPSLPNNSNNSNHSNYSKMQDSPSPMHHQGMPFMQIGAGGPRKRGDISIGGTGLGVPSHRPDLHSLQNSPQKKHHPKSQASWHSEGAEKEMNPEPLPFMPSEFKSPLERVCVNGVPLPGINIPKDIADSVIHPSNKQAKSDRSSTVIKKMPLQQRHSEMWASEQLTGPRPKGYALHTERYGFDELRKSPEMMASGVAMDSNLEYLYRMRQPRKPKPREPLNLVMGGQQVAMFERDDIQDEVRKLKTIMLPKKAKDLYVGRGFKIPEFHAINNPRQTKTKDVAFDTRRSEVRPDYYSNRDPNVKFDGGWSRTELKTPSPEPSSTAVIIPRENTIEMGTDPPPRSATTKTATTPNPLRGGPLENFVESSEFDKLKKTFKRLDTDMDGHLQFLQLKSQLPKGISHAQERFIKMIYDITSSSTFFGLNEYISMSVMCQRIAALQGPAKEAFQKLNFATIESTVKFYTDLFQSMDRSNSGKISEDSLRHILNTALEEKLQHSQFNDLIQNMQVNGDINKMDFLAYIPYFLTLENLYIHS